MTKIQLLLTICICWAGIAQAQVVVNEYSAANLTFTKDNYGKYEDWIELHNTTAQSLNVSGWYLSDDEDEPTKWKIPTGTSIVANGFLVVWCSGRDEKIGSNLHSNFKFQQTRNKAEHVVLANPSGVIVFDEKLRKTQVNQSVGRTTDNGPTWGIAKTPTPKTKNTNTTWFTRLAKTPAMDQAAGFYPGSIAVALSTEDSNAVVRYTLDGTLPDVSSPAYTAPILVSQTTIIKAVTFSNDPTVLPSFVEFNTYFINESFTLPVVSTAGTDLTDLANGQKELRPFGTFEYFGVDKDRKATVTGELNSHGQDSWVNAQRGLDWVSRDEMGEDAAIKEALFPEFTDRDKFQRIIFRAAGDDNYPGGSGYTGPDGRPQAAHLRDAYTQNLAKRGGLNIDTRTGGKAIIFLNGQYWGVYDLREIPDDHDYTDYNYDQGKFDLQYLKTWGWTWVEYWDVDSSDTYPQWRNLWEYIQENDMADEQNFNFVKSQLDYTSLVDYLLVNSFANASDWLNYNTGWWRGMNPDGDHQKWGYVLWDLDATYAYYINYTGIPDTSATSPPCNVELITAPWSDPEGHVTLANKLRENPEFDQYWITRQADLMKSTFSCENMLQYFDEVVASIEPEMPRHIARWGGTVQEWKKNVKQLRYFIERRCAYLPTGMGDCYGVTGPFNSVLRVKPDNAGNIRANTLTYANFPVETPFFANIELKLEATPDSGYVFSHWETVSNNVFDPNSPKTAMYMTGPDSITAVFKQGNVSTQVPVQSTAQVSAYPTLFDANLTVEFEIPAPRKVNIRLLDVLGREMKTLQTGGSQALPAGRHTSTLVFDKGSSLQAGVYFIAYRDDSGAEKTIKVIRQGE